MTPIRRTRKPLLGLALTWLRRGRSRSPQERFMRNVVAMAERHPERYTSRSSRQERQLLTWHRRQMWPGREYIEIRNDELGGRA